MALFQKKPDLGKSISFYTIGQNNIILIVGLGNIGSEYDGTRHNIGFAALDHFARTNDFEGWVEKKDLKCHIANGRLGESKVMLIKPTTYMNLSGEAVQAVMHFYKVQPERVTAVYDEIDIPFGQIRTRVGGGSAGHNGVKSLMQHVGEGFGRVRVGIGPKQPEQMDTADFVLQRFSAEQQEAMPALTRETSAILSEYAFGGGQQLPAETRPFL